MRTTILAPLVFLLSVGLLSVGAAAACGSLPGDAGVRQSLLAEVNALRADAGLGRLSPSRKLESVAEGHACDMAERGYFSHVSPDGLTFKNRVRSGGLISRSAVENIAITPGADAARVVRMWRESPSHRANLMRRDLREVGFSARVGAGNVLWVMVGAS
jgi:uncharacterized protein YkwD